MRPRNGVAVLLVDVINSFAFEGAAPLIQAAKCAARPIAALVENARSAGVPIVYVNDNFGRWSSDFRATVAECTKRGSAGAAIARLLRPHRGDYFVLKPQYSGFYRTPLDLLLEHLDIDTVILAGFAANLCVLFTANDAHMHGLHIVVPSDCVAANSISLTQDSLRHVRVALGGRTPRARAIDFTTFRRRARKPRGQAFGAHRDEAASGARGRP